MSEANDVHQRIEDKFVENLQAKGIKPEVTEELICVLSANRNPKASDLLQFYDRQSTNGADE